MKNWITLTDPSGETIHVRADQVAAVTIGDGIGGAHALVSLAGGGELIDCAESVAEVMARIEAATTLLADEHTPIGPAPAPDGIGLAGQGTTVAHLERI